MHSQTYILGSYTSVVHLPFLWRSLASTVRALTVPRETRRVFIAVLFLIVFSVSLLFSSSFYDWQAFSDVERIYVEYARCVIKQRQQWDPTSFEISYSFGSERRGVEIAIEPAGNEFRNSGEAETKIDTDRWGKDTEFAWILDKLDRSHELHRYIKKSINKSIKPMFFPSLLYKIVLTIKNVYVSDQIIISIVQSNQLIEWNDDFSISFPTL